MARVVGVYALVLVCVGSAFVFGALSWAYSRHSAVLIYSSEYLPSFGREILQLDFLTQQTHVLIPSAVSGYAWSPNGMMLAYETRYTSGMSSNIETHVNIEIADWKGNLISTIAGAGLVSSPHWLDDNRTIVFLSSSDLGSEIYSVDVNNPNHWYLFTQIQGNYVIDYVSVSPDSRMIAFTVVPSGVFILDRENGNVEQIAHNGFKPTWSPDGERIAFWAFNEVRNLDIYVFNVVDRMGLQLTNHDAAEFEPAWSPDGSQIAFVSDRDGDYEIFVMNANGTNVRQVTFNDVNDTDPAWIP